MRSCMSTLPSFVLATKVPSGPSAFSVKQALAGCLCHSAFGFTTSTMPTRSFAIQRLPLRQKRISSVLSSILRAKTSAEATKQSSSTKSNALFGVGLKHYLLFVGTTLGSLFAGATAVHHVLRPDLVRFTIIVILLAIS